jgi:hypothetical protein
VPYAVGIGMKMVEIKAKEPRDWPEAKTILALLRLPALDTLVLTQGHLKWTFERQGGIWSWMMDENEAFHADNDSAAPMCPVETWMEILLGVENWQRVWLRLTRLEPVFHLADQLWFKEGLRVGSVLSIFRDATLTDDDWLEDMSVDDIRRIRRVLGANKLGSLTVSNSLSTGTARPTAYGTCDRPTQWAGHSLILSLSVCLDAILRLNVGTNHLRIQVSDCPTQWGALRSGPGA